MRKNYLLRLIFLTPIVALILMSSAFFIWDYPQSVANIDHLVTNLTLEEQADVKTSLPITNHDESLFNKQKISILENRLRELEESLNSAPRSININDAKKILSCTVRITRGNATGTGVVVYESKIDDIVYTYIITNAHVVGDAKEIEAIRYKYLRNASISSTETYKGKVLERETTIDLALIEIQTPESIGPAVEFDTTDLENGLSLHDNVYVVGCPLGNPPMITNGTVAFISNTRNIITAFSIFGSSGGGVFDGHGKLVGLVRGITMVESNENTQIPITHLSHMIPGPVIRSWLIVKGYSFVLRDGTHESYLTNRSTKATEEKKEKPRIPKSLMDLKKDLKSLREYLKTIPER